MQQKVCRLACFGELGWMTVYLNNTYGFIRHGDSRSNSLRLLREVAVWLMFLDTMVTYDRSIGTREAFTQEAARFVSFSDPGEFRKGPARQGPSGRQLYV